MDLRPYRLSAAQTDRIVVEIRRNLLRYQPWIFTETLEVGEGQNYIDRYKDGLSGNNVYADRPLGIDGVQAADPAHFRRCNAGFRRLYDLAAETIRDEFGPDISRMNFAEIGCNSGLHLFNLARMGAAQCAGYDWNDMQPTFDILNEVLDVNVEFKRSRWDALSHRMAGMDLPEVDVMITGAFVNHQFDPLQHLAYICDRSRIGVFLWVLIDLTNHCAVNYPNSTNHILRNQPFPTCFDNMVTLSPPLLQICLESLGFEGMREVAQPDEPEWKQFTGGWRMYVARRARPVRSAFWQRDRA